MAMGSSALSKSISSSSSASASKKNQSNQKRSGDEVQATDASRSGRYDEVTDKWIPEKPVSAVEGASYGVVGLIGLGIAAGAAWFARAFAFGLVRFVCRQTSLG